ncbi:DNA primase family protein [Runella aurantiaca]|nr:phage/plasmid primase, P4 family [Runella aurantiaca]
MSKITDIPDNKQVARVGFAENFQIFERIINLISKVNFRKLAGKDFVDDEAKKIGQKHHLIICVEHLIKIANGAGYDISKYQGSIYVYNGSFWQLSNDEDLKDLLGKVAEKMGIDRYNARFYDFKEKLFKQFISSARLKEVLKPKDSVLINLLNGTFEINAKNQKLRDFKKSDFITYQLPFNYDQKAECPLFMTYLNKVLPDTGLQDILAEYMGYVFVKHLKLEKALLLYGSGANGKSVFFEVMNAILGTQNVTNYSLQSLSNEAYRANLANKLLNYGSEIKSGLQSDIFKLLVSGEPVDAKPLYKQPFIMNDYAKLMFNCNELPKEVEHTDAYFRRFLIIPFEVTIPENERDSQLPKKIINSELSGVFNWILKGLNRIVANAKFTDSEHTANILNKYRNESDSVFQFLLEGDYTPDAKSVIKLAEMYGDFSKYCTNSGYRALNLKHFQERLEKKGFRIDKRNVGKVVFCKKYNDLT